MYLVKPTWLAFYKFTLIISFTILCTYPRNMRCNFSLACLISFGGISCYFIFFCTSIHFHLVYAFPFYAGCEPWHAFWRRPPQRLLPPFSSSSGSLVSPPRRLKFVCAHVSFQGDERMKVWRRQARGVCGIVQNVPTEFKSTLVGVVVQ